jgi:phosphate transport system substrate-binding protein
VQEAGIGITEVKIGFDGIAIANSKAAPQLTLTKVQLFQALAAKLPKDGKLIDNPNTTWKDIDASLPAAKIEVLGPPPTSGTRDAFVELVMEDGCKHFDGAKVAGLEGKACHVIREDGAFVEAGENDNLIVQKLEANKDAVGIFGFSFLDQNADKVQGAIVDGSEPTFENIASGDYGVSRSLFFYVKQQHVGVVPGIKEFVAEFTSDKAWGDDGYLVDKGLIPLPNADRDEMAKQANELAPLTM